MNGAGEDRKHWSQVADEWVAWARKPNHDAFWAYRASLAAFIGRGNGKALDVGCGEGRISRELTACGFEVTAVDPVSRLVGAAIEAQSARNYAVASAADLPFENAQFDLVQPPDEPRGRSDLIEGIQACAPSCGTADHFHFSSICGSWALRQQRDELPFCRRGDLLRKATLRRCRRTRWPADAICRLELPS
jgi:SAM-dependent methyltransferase